MSKRKPNWSSVEIETLVVAVTENIKVIKGKFTPTLTNEAKNRQWTAITERVNAVNSSEVQRDVTDVKKKWQDLCSQTKKREAGRRREMHMTGGGPQCIDELKSWEQMIVGTMTNSALEGVPGGVDTGALAPVSTPYLEKESSYVLPEATPAGQPPAFVPDNRSESGGRHNYATYQYIHKLKKCFIGLHECSYSYDTYPVQESNMKIPDSPYDNTRSPEGTSEEYETVIFANSLPSADGAATCTPAHSQSKKKRKSSTHYDGNEDKAKAEFLNLEKRKLEDLRMYREKKLALYEKMVQQQSEILENQRKSTAALELLANKFQPSITSSPFSVSPVIRFDQL